MLRVRYCDWAKAEEELPMNDDQEMVRTRRRGGEDGWNFRAGDDQAQGSSDRLPRLAESLMGSESDW